MIDMRGVVLVLMLALVLATLSGCERMLAFLPGFNNQEVMLSDKPAMLGKKPIRFSGDEPLKIVGKTSDFCVTLSKDEPSVDDTDAQFETLMGGAKLSAVLNATDGKKYRWTCNGWSFYPNNSGSGRMSACFRWECNQTPPTGTEITSIDVSSDRPLRILGADWSSTAAFDHVSDPPPDTVAISSTEYRELEAAYGGKPAWSSPELPLSKLTLSSNRRRVSNSTFNSTVSVRLTDAGIQLQPGSTAVDMAVVTIPTSAVEACSMTCWGNLARETELLLPGSGVQLSFLNKPEVTEWCWRNRIPMVLGADHDAWYYNQKALPPRESYAKQFDAKASYDHQAHQSCMGY
jgi:hypothetical protein